MKTTIFVPDAHAHACIAAIRSLGRAGYNVHAGSSSINALGLKSSFANQSVIYPPFYDPNFITWMKNYVAKYDIKMIVPSNGVLRALLPAFSDFKYLLPVTSEKEVLKTCFSKAEVVKKFMLSDPSLGLTTNHPSSSVIDLSSKVDSCLLPKSKLGFYIKAEQLRPLGHPSSLSFAYAENSLVALDILKKMSVDWETALIQEACTGIQVGISVLIDNGKALAVSCVRDCYPRPHSKGTMSLRESCWYPEIANDAIKRLSFLNWKGCAMGEYRFDEQKGIFNLIEINFRYWKYLHLDLWAGMDFPRMQAEWFLDGKTQFENEPRVGVICRDTWPGEVAHVVNELRNKETGIFAKIITIASFFGKFFNPRIHQDFLFPGDRMLYWVNFYEYLISDSKRLIFKIKLKISNLTT
jgi:hypothetical protein